LSATSPLDSKLKTCRARRMLECMERAVEANFALTPYTPTIQVIMQHERAFAGHGRAFKRRILTLRFRCEGTLLNGPAVEPFPIGTDNDRAED